MSRIGKQQINIPENTEIKLDGGLLTVKGPLGELKREFKSDVEIAVVDNNVEVKPKKENNFTKALWGTYASHVINMIEGVNKGFKKALIIEGVGYRAAVESNTLVLNVGFSHQVKIPIPEGLDTKVEKSLITISGIDKEKVGQFAAKVRSVKKPEPYKGKGIRYEDEVIRRKQGKKAVT